VRHDVVRCTCGVARYNKPSKEELAEYCRQKVKQINDTGNPGPGMAATLDSCPSMIGRFEKEE